MRIFQTWLDGGSIILALILFAAAIATFAENDPGNGWRIAKWAVVTLFMFGGVVLSWLAYRIGSNRKTLRDPSRWLGPTDNCPSDRNP